MLRGQSESFVEQLDKSGDVHERSCSPETAPILQMSRDSSADPIVHREKIWISVLPRNLCVARPVGRAEIDRTLAVKKAMQKEWDRLRSKYVLDEDHPRQWDVVGGLPVALLLTCRSRRNRRSTSFVPTFLRFCMGRCRAAGEPDIAEFFGGLFGCFRTPHLL